jgi:hypothetical protein
VTAGDGRVSRGGPALSREIRPKTTGWGAGMTAALPPFVATDRGGDGKKDDSMISLMVWLLGFSLQGPAQQCEEHGPRLDGTYVTICNGSVTRVRDGIGNVREWDTGGQTVTVRSPGGPTMVIGRDGR